MVHIGAVERAVTRARSTVSLYDLYEAVDDDAAVSGHRYCSIYTWVVLGAETGVCSHSSADYCFRLGCSNKAE
jgi:hypothetical protein